MDIKRNVKRQSLKDIISEYERDELEDWVEMKYYEFNRIIEEVARKAADVNKEWVTLGVGSGDGNKFVHGDHESINRVREIIFEWEKYKRKYGAL